MERLFSQAGSSTNGLRWLLRPRRGSAKIGDCRRAQHQIKAIARALATDACSTLVEVILHEQVLDSWIEIERAAHD